MKHEMEALRQMLTSEGWAKVFSPTLQRTIVADMDSLASPKRPEGISDDYLRGRISAVRDVLTTFNRRLDEYDFEQQKLRDAESQAAAAEKGSGSPYEKE